jgi:hypothetical protein
MKVVVDLRVVVEANPVLKAFYYVNFVDMYAYKWVIPNIFNALIQHPDDLGLLFFQAFFG